MLIFYKEFQVSFFLKESNKIVKCVTEFVIENVFG